MRIVLAFAIAVASSLWAPAPAGAQTSDEERAVTIEYDVGDFDAEAGDWLITVVYVSGDLAPGEAFTVELRGDGGQVVWAGTDTFDGSTVALAVEDLVAVGDVTEAAISQSVPAVAGDVVTRPVPEVLQQGGGGGGGGQLALSMVVAVILVAILFRSPLPSASTQRWTK